MTDFESSDMQYFQEIDRPLVSFTSRRLFFGIDTSASYAYLLRPLVGEGYGKPFLLYPSPKHRFWRNPMKKLLAVLVSGFSMIGLLGLMTQSAASPAVNDPDAIQAQQDSNPARCTGPIPLYVLRCADGTTEGPFWDVRDGECQLIPACTDHGGPFHMGSPKIVGAGEECNGSLPPEYATLCEEGLTCVRDNDRLGSSGICMTIGHLGDRCDSNRYQIRWVHCEDGLQCKPIGIPIMIGTVPVMTCQK
jgi:hypothetical protein